MNDPKAKKTKAMAVIHPRIVRGLRKLGEDISLARRVRKISAEEFAQRIGVSRATLHRLERGDPGIALNTLAMAFHALGRLDALVNLADPTADHVTLMEMRDQVPKRISKPRGRATIKGEGVQAVEVTNGKFVGF